MKRSRHKSFLHRSRNSRLKCTKVPFCIRIHGLFSLGVFSKNFLDDFRFRCRKVTLIVLLCSIKNLFLMWSFQHIWCLGPCLRTWKINCAFFRTFTTVCMAASCGPCAETCGLYFAKIKVRYQRLPDSDGGDHKDIMIV